MYLTNSIKYAVKNLDFSGTASLNNNIYLYKSQLYDLDRFERKLNYLFKRPQYKCNLNNGTFGTASLRCLFSCGNIPVVTITQSARVLCSLHKIPAIMTLSLNDPVLQTYIVYSAILALKLLFLSVFTSSKRIPRGVFSNPEDCFFSFGGAKVKYDDPVVERVRRAHLNDLENIPAFWILGALYLTTGPGVFCAQMLFRVYTASRIVHTVVYAVVPMPQPTRAIAFFIPYFIMWYMGIQTVIYYLTAL